MSKGNLINSFFAIFIIACIFPFNHPLYAQTTLIQADAFPQEGIRKLTKSVANTYWGINLFSRSYRSSLSYTTDYYGEVNHAIMFIIDPNWERMVYSDLQCDWIRAWGHGELNFPHGITSDNYSYTPSRFNIYIADTGNDRIVHLRLNYYNPYGYPCEPSFDIEESLTDASAGLSKPYDVDLNDGGDLWEEDDDYLWVADFGNHMIKRFTMCGDLVKSFGSYGSGSNQFKYPKAIVNGRNFQSGKNNKYLYVVDSGNNRIVKLYDPTPTTVQWVSTYEPPSESNLTSIETDTYGNVWVTEFNNGRILKLTPDLELLTTFGSQGTGDDQFLYPTGFSTPGAFQYQQNWPPGWIRGFADAFIAEKWTDNSGGQRYLMGVDVVNFQVTTNSSQSTAYCSFTLTDQADVTVKVYDSGNNLITTLRDEEMATGAVGPIAWSADARPWGEYRIEVTAVSLYLLGGTGPPLNDVTKNASVWVGQKAPQITRGPVIYYGSDCCAVANHTYTVSVYTNDLTGDNFSYDWWVDGDPDRPWIKGTITGDGRIVQYTAPGSGKGGKDVLPENRINVSISFAGNWDSGNTGWFGIHNGPCECGCPFVFTWDGREYVEDNNILPSSELSPGEGNITDKYKLGHQPVVKDKSYLLQIREFEHEHSYLDQVKLLAVDHPGDVLIGLNPEGEIIPYRRIALPLSCVDDSARDRLKLINGVDDQYFQGHKDNWLVLGFGGIGKREANLETISSQKAMDTIVLQIQRGKGWEDVALLHPRENWSAQLIDLSPFVAAGRERFKLRLLWKSDHKLDYIGLAQPQVSDIRVHECPLKSAVHSRIGSVTKHLLSVDKKYAELIPGESIDLAYSSLKPNEGYRRDFILVSTGYYVKGKRYTHLPKDISDHLIPTSFSLSQNYPNPFNPITEIKYALPKDCRVKLTIYNILGQKVITLVNEPQAAGYKIVHWDSKSQSGNEVTSGIYFYRLKAGDFVQKRKMVLIR